jgi:hypothetical protein
MSSRRTGELVHPRQSLSGTLNSIRNILGRFAYCEALRSFPGLKPVNDTATHVEQYLSQLSSNSAAQPPIDTATILASKAKALEDMLQQLFEATKGEEGIHDQKLIFLQGTQNEAPVLMKSFLQTFLQWAPRWLDDEDANVLREDFDKLPEDKSTAENDTKGNEETKGPITNNNQQHFGNGSQFVNSGLGGRFNYTETAHNYHSAVNQYHRPPG